MEVVTFKGPSLHLIPSFNPLANAPQLETTISDPPDRLLQLASIPPPMS
jgi:hypothetical protein